MSTQQPVLANAEYAGFSMRFLALLLDGLVVALPSLLIALGSAGVWYSIDSYLFREVPEFFAYLVGGAWWVALWVIGIPYCWLFTAVRGQTPGKMILGIRVVHSQSGRSTLGRAALREVAIKPMLLLFAVGPLLLLGGISFVSGPDPTNILVELFSWVPGPWWLILWLFLIVIPLGLLGFLSMTWDSRKQGWHDKIAGTRVLRLPPRPEELHRKWLHRTYMQYGHRGR